MTSRTPSVLEMRKAVHLINLQEPKLISDDNEEDDDYQSTFSQSSGDILSEEEEFFTPRSGPSTIGDTSEYDDKFKEEFVELVTKAIDYHKAASKTMKESQECLKKMYEELSSSYDTLIKEMMEDVETMEKVLLSSHHENPSKAFAFMERLKSSLNAPSYLLMEVMVKAKRQQLAEAHKVLKDFLTAKRGEIFKYRIMFLDFLRDESSESSSSNTSSIDVPLDNRKPNMCLVNVTAVSDPGQFYVIDWCRIKERAEFFTLIQDAAPNCSLPEVILPDQVYAVLDSHGKWFRATVGYPSCSIVQVEDEPSEPIFKCFLVDVGHYERILKSNIRVLSKDLRELPPFAKECSLDAGFKPQFWSSESITLFEMWTRHGPLKMQVFSIEKGVLIVDLFHSKECGRTVSMMDSLMLKACSEPSPTPFISKEFSIVKVLKPKYGVLALRSNPPKFATVLITKAASPRDMYIQIEDDGLRRYHKMQKDLQEEFRSVTTLSDSYCRKPVIGHYYAAQCGIQWCRVQIEGSERHEEAFFVDLGRRKVIHPDMMFHELPDRFAELPAQAVRCFLSGVQAPTKNPSGSSMKGRRTLPNGGKFPYKMFDFMPRYEGKTAVAIFEHWDAGKVGRLSQFREELRVEAILYPIDDVHSINVQVGETSLARLDRKRLELPEHYEIRKRVAAQSGYSPVLPRKASSSIRQLSVRGHLPSNDGAPRIRILRRAMSWK